MLLKVHLRCIQGKDETLLCSLSNFDTYHFSRSYKSPKPFVFAIKSTDKLSFFENTQDYLHVISCAEKEGRVWMDKILLARVCCLPSSSGGLTNKMISVVCVASGTSCSF